MRLFIYILRRIFKQPSPTAEKRKQMIEQLKRLKKRDKQERDSI